MKFTIEIAIGLLMLGSYTAEARPPAAPKQPMVTVVTDSKLFCKVDEITERKCAHLIDSQERPIRGGETCKEHGLAKGRECLKVSKAKKVKVKLKFTEQLGANRNYTYWTCELDSRGGHACP